MATICERFDIIQKYLDLNIMNIVYIDQTESIPTHQPECNT